MKDTLKISGVQVSPTEIENVLLAQPDRLITDVCVAGVPGGRSLDEKVPRSWVVLSDEGVRLGEATTIQRLDAWVKQNLSSYKWLRGGIEIVDEVSSCYIGKHDYPNLIAYLDSEASYRKGSPSCPAGATR